MSFNNNFILALKIPRSIIFYKFFYSVFVKGKLAF